MGQHGGSCGNKILDSKVYTGHCFGGGATDHSFYFLQQVHQLFLFYVIFADSVMT